MADYAVMPKSDYRDACNAVREKTGGTESIKSGDMGDLIRRIQSGVELPELTEPAAEGEVFLGKETINSSGEKMTGTFTIDSEMTEQDTLIDQIAAALEGKSAGGGVVPTGQIAINANGTYDVTDYASAKVNVPTGGSTASIPTCSLRLVWACNYASAFIGYTRYYNGVVNSYIADMDSYGGGEEVIENIVCGSLLIVDSGGEIGTEHPVATGGCVEDPYSPFWSDVFRVTAPAGGEAVITFVV
jgi:hypothetical protein